MKIIRDLAFEIKQFKNNKEAINGFINKLTAEQLYEVITTDEKYFAYIENPKWDFLKIVLDCGEMKNGFVRFITDREVLLKIISYDPELILIFENPDEEMQLKAVENSVESLELIDNPTELVKKVAVLKSPESIRFLKHPSQELCDLATDKDPSTIQYITKDRQTEEMKWKVLKVKADYISYIINPTKEMQLFAANNYKIGTWGIDYVINEADEGAKDIYISKEPLLIRHIKKPSKKLQIKAVGLNYRCVRLIKSPCKEVKIMAINQDPEIIDELSWELTKEEQQIYVDSCLKHLVDVQARHIPDIDLNKVQDNIDCVNLIK